MRRNILAIIILAVALSGCAGTKVGDFIATATSTIVNPVDKTQMYRAANVYAATLTLADDYRTYCYARPYKVLLADPVAKALCQSRRDVIRKIQAAQLKAQTVAERAWLFVENNPTVNASALISEVWNAVLAFQAAVPKIPG